MDWFANLPPGLESGSYFLIFTLLVLCGLGFPLPEEVSFLLGGYLVHKMGGNLYVMIIVAICGVLLGDILLFALASRHGIQFLKIWPFSIIFSEERLTRGRNYFRKHGSKTVFFASFFAGIRATVFFLSASMGVRFHVYFFWDCLRIMLTCPISVWFGYKFGPYAQEKLAPYHFWLFSALGLGFAVILLRGIWNRWKRAKG